MKLGILSRKSDLYSTRRLKEAAIQRGHEVKIIDHLKCDMIIEQNVLENLAFVLGLLHVRWCHGMRFRLPPRSHP